jgi:hypothetical protein
VPYILLVPVVQQNLETLIQKGTALLRGGKFHYLDFPRGEAEPITIYTNGGFWLWGHFNNKVEFDSHTGKVQRVIHQSQMSGKQKLEYALYTLHYGQYGGKGIKLLYCLH